MNDSTGTKHTSLLQFLKAKAQQLKHETYALALAYRDPRTPWYARIWAALVIAYAVSPIDLIPDFVPLLGYLDDLLLIPAGVALAIRMIPVTVMQEAREKAARDFSEGKSIGFWGAAIVILIWLIVLALTGLLVYGLINK